ncbi:MAG: flippase-like domain-containing protein [Candidatus Cloacimonetes bacterium]|nr:flippase-like domain-containing protein [Candidatus Cloacimonadota bacterium]
MTRKRLLLLGKIILSALVLWLVFRQIDGRDLAGSFARLDLPVLLLLLLTAAVKFALDYINWYWYLHLDPGFSPSHRDALRSHTIGMALRFVVPGGHGIWGKVFFVGNSKRMTALSVGIERFLLWWTSILFAAVAALFHFREVALWIRLTALVAALLMPVAAWLGWRLWKRQSKLPGRYMVLVPRALLTRGLYVLITVVQYWWLLNRLGEIGFVQSLVAVPLILFANTIPITYGGLGLREGFAVHVLAGFGLPAAVAVTASLTVFFINTLLPAVPGALLILLDRRRRPKKD